MKKLINGLAKNLAYFCLAGLIVLGLMNGDVLGNEPLKPAAGEWQGSPGDLRIDFVVASNGDGLEEIKLNFYDFSCGGYIYNGSITFQSSPPFPITNSSFEESLVFSANETVTIKGTFDSSGESASGTYEAVFYGEICDGIWDASPLIAISGTIMSGDEDEEDEPVPGARVSASDVNEIQIAADTSDIAGEFSLDVPKASKFQLLVEGPVGSEKYIGTHYPFMEIADFEPEDLSDLELYIVLKADAEWIMDALGADPSKGVIVAVAAASDVSGLPGVSFSITDYQSGDAVDADIIYFDENDDPDPGLSETSSEGSCIIYNIPLEGAESRDVRVTAEKQGYDFFPSWPHGCRVYPYQASPEKVTVVPFEGAGSEAGGHRDNCFIATAGAK